MLPKVWLGGVATMGRNQEVSWKTQSYRSALIGTSAHEENITSKTHV